MHTVTDYGDENPLLYDYFGFQPSLYKLKFKSRGDSELSQRIVDLFKEVRKSASEGAPLRTYDWTRRLDISLVLLL